MTELVLGIVLLLTNAFWAWQTQRLINKLMSRNYFEFKEAELSADKLKGKLINSAHEAAVVFDDSHMGSVKEIF